MTSRLTLTVLDASGVDADVQKSVRPDMAKVHDDGNSRAVFEREQ